MAIKKDVRPSSQLISRKNVVAIRSAERATGLIAGSMTYSLVFRYEVFSVRFHLGTDVKDEAVLFA